MERTRRLAVLATTLFALALAPTALAAPGDVDTAFGGGDGIELNRPSDTSSPAATTGLRSRLLADGSVYVAARARENVLIAKLDATGALDASFATNGVYELDVTGNSYDDVHAIEVDFDGKVVVAGRGGNDAFVLRLLANGQPDATFSGDGLAIYSTGGLSSVEFTGLAFQGAGNLVVITPSLGDLTLMRYLPTGVLDSSFGSGGVRTIAGVSPGGGSPPDVFVDGMNRIIVGGDNGGSGFEIVGLTADGDLNSLYDGDGIANTGSLPGNYVDGALDSLGRLVVVSADSGATYVARIDQNGGLDPNFSGDGMAAFDPTGNTEDPGAVEVFGSTVYVAGRQDNFGGFIARYDGNGAPDATFQNAAAGYVQTSCVPGGGTLVCSIHDLSINPSGTALSWIAESSDSNAYTTFDVGVTQSSGAPLATFDTDGKRRFQVDTPDSNYPYQSYRSTDGKILVTGIAGPYNNEDTLLSLYNADGTLDTTFGTGGSVVHDVYPTEADYPVGAVREPSGAVTVFGWRPGTPDDQFWMAKFGADGTFNSLYGVNEVNIDPDNEYPAGFELQGDGSVLFSATVYNGPTDRSVLVSQLDSSGATDSGFNSGSPRVLPFSTTDNLPVGKPVLAPAGRIVVPFIRDKTLSMLWLTATGALDTSIDPTGVTSYPAVGTMNDTVGAPEVRLVGDDFVVLGASTGNPTGSDLFVAKIDQNGALDGAFGTGGVTDITFPTSGNEEGGQMLVDSSGRIIVVTDDVDGGTSNRRFIAVRLSPGGVIDSTFGGLHSLAIPAGIQPSNVVGLEQSGNRLLVYGGITESVGGKSYLSTVGVVNDVSVPNAPPVAPPATLPTGPSAACITAKKKLTSLQKKLKKQKKTLKRSKTTRKKTSLRKQIKKTNRQIKTQKRTVKRLCV